MIGTLLDSRYEIRSLLGAGAMGSVYEAQHTGTGRRVAIKVINSGDLSRDEKLVGRFQREAKAAGSIDTQHITQVLDTGLDRESGAPYMVMEYLQGEDLQHLFKRIGPLSPDLALRLVAQACLGLQKAHDAQVVHRDIKPANLFLAQRDGGELIVKLLDFGIAKVKMDHANDAESAGLTKTGSMLGSPLYMSPEQARGSKHIDHRADLWSLGVVLYQALCGRTPYQHIDALGELIISICHETPPPIQTFAPWIPPEVARVVRGALTRDPAERFQTAGAMLDAVRPLLPYGWTITSEMIAPLSAEARAYVAARASAPPPPMPLADSGSIMGRSAMSSMSSMSSMHPPSLIGSTSGLVQSQQIAPKRSALAPLAVAVAVLGVGIGGLAWYTISRSNAAEAAAQAAAQQAAAAAAAPPVTAAPAPQPTVVVQVAAPPVTRTVKLVIVPADAVIELDGDRGVAKDGILEITGTLGSVHKVRLAKGASEHLGEVIVTESGASPPKLEIRPGGGVTRSTAAPAATAAPATAPPAPAAPGIVDTFD